MNPRVSVIVATRDYGRYLAETLASVIAQTFTDWELLIVDDGSRDHTPAVIAPFLSDPRIRCVRSDGLGQSRAKNLGIRMTHAPLVAFLDGDDWWLPTKLEQQVRLFEQQPDVGVVYSRRHLVNEAGEPIGERTADFHRGMVYPRMLLTNFVCFSSAMVRRDVFEHVGVFDERLDLAVDYDLWLRVAKHWEFDYVDEALVNYRTGHGNLSKRIGERIATVFAIMRRSLQRRGGEALLPAAVQRDAWGSTCRTMAYVERANRPAEAIVWYWHAAMLDRRWLASARAIGRNAWNLMRMRPSADHEKV